MYKFKVVGDLPLNARGGRTYPIIEQVLKADIDQWIEVTGFKDKKEIISVASCLRSGKRSFAARLKQGGLKISVRIDSARKTLYVRKCRISQAKI